MRFVVSHPSNKNKGVARMGHPTFVLRTGYPTAVTRIGLSAPRLEFLDSITPSEWVPGVTASSTAVRYNPN